jgi:RNA polymerase sigma factor (sigma-70 family)
MTNLIPCTEWRRVLPHSAEADRSLEKRTASDAPRAPKRICPRKGKRQTGSTSSPDGRLSSQNVVALVRRIQAGDSDARNTMILANSRLVAKIARRYTSCGSTLADLMQAGHCGLIRAAECYDPATQRAPFSSYAALWIMKTIQRAIAENSSLVRMPHRLFWLQGRYRKVIAELTAASNGNTHDFDPAEVASRMRISPKRLSSLVKAMIHQEPFSAKGENGKERSLEESIPDKHRPDLELEQAEEAELLHAALDRLAPFEAWLIRRRFGLDDPTGLSTEQGSNPQRRPSSEEIGRSLGITALRIREIEQIALQKLRSYLMPQKDRDQD